MIDTFRKIYTNEGIAGFYKGLTPNIMKIFPSSGIFFLVYELTLNVLNSEKEWSRFVYIIVWVQYFIYNLCI